METKKRDLLIILILGSLTTIGPFSIDMYLPAFPKIAADFNTTTSRVALSLSSYFIGLAVGQIFYGPFLDRFGRKRPIYFGLILYIFASLACAYAQSVDQLISIRFFQALGGCAASVAATAMVRDFFSPKDGAKVFSRLMLILSVSPLFAPTVGGWVMSYWSWQSVFFILAGIVAIILATVFLFLPEGHEPDPTVELRLKPIVATFRDIYQERQFFAFALSGAFSFASLFTYLAGAPAIFMGMFELNEKIFGLIFAGLSIGMIGGGQVNILLTKKFTSYQIFKTALRVQWFVGCALLIGCVFNIYDLYAHVAIFFIYISCIGLTYPNAASTALAPFRKTVGSASALLGSVQMCVGAIASALFGLLPFAPNIAVAIVFVLTATVGNYIFWRSKIKYKDLIVH